MNEEYVDIAPFPIYFEPPQKIQPLPAQDYQDKYAVNEPIGPGGTINSDKRVQIMPISEVAPRGAQPSIKDAVLPLLVYVGIYFIVKNVYEAVTK